MTSSKQDRTLALAGLFQAAQAVDDLSKTSICDEHSYNALIDSLFILNPESTLDVYGNDIRNLEGGLTLLSNVSNNKFNKDFGDPARYALSMLAVEKQLSQNSGMLDIMSNRLKHMQYGKEHFSDNSTNLPSNLSGLYQDTISTLKFRIQVTGNMQYLTDTSVSDRIRTMLFAGIRSAMLWRQLGGTKWQLIFGRGELERNSKALLDQISQTTKH